MGKVLIIVAVLVLIILVWFIKTSNSLNASGIKIDEANSGIEIALEKRYDAVKQCFAAAKNLAGHESELVMGALQYRNGMSVKELSSLSDQLDSSVRQISALAENYPQLQSNKAYENLQAAIMDTEDDLQASRRIYNSNVTYYNKMVACFPSSIVASMKNCTARDFFKGTESKSKGFEIPM